MLIIGGIGTSLFAYKLTRPRRAWPSTPTYIVDQSGHANILDSDGGVSSAIFAITRNVAWNGAGTGTVVNAVAGDVDDWRLGDGVPMLSFDDPDGVCTGNCLSATFTSYVSGEKSLHTADADSIINPNLPWTSKAAPGGCDGRFFIEGVLVQEVGHGLGLNHSKRRNATMFASVSKCNNRSASTHADDEAGILNLYGGRDGGTCALLPRGAACTQNNQCCTGRCRGEHNKSCG